MMHQALSQPAPFFPSTLSAPVTRLASQTVPTTKAQIAPADASQPKIRTIAVPLDGTTYAEHALPHALAMARRCGASLRLIQANSGINTTKKKIVRSLWLTQWSKECLNSNSPTRNPSSASHQAS